MGKIEFTDEKTEEKLQEIRERIFRKTDEEAQKILKEHFLGKTLYEIISTVEMIKCNVIMNTMIDRIKRL